MSNPFQDSRAEALQKIGRNVVNFQRFERLLKEILAKSQVEGAPADLLKIAARREESISKLTLGILVGEFVGSVHTVDSQEEPADIKPPENWEGPWFAAGYRVILEEADLAELKKALRQVVDDRNELVHQRLATVDLNSIEACQDLIKELDKQHERLEPHFKSAIRTFRSMTELRGAMASIDFGEEHTPQRDVRVLGDGRTDE